jgi:hypothetical protein
MQALPMSPRHCCFCRCQCHPFPPATIIAAVSTVATTMLFLLPLLLPSVPLLPQLLSKDGKISTFYTTNNLIQVLPHNTNSNATIDITTSFTCSWEGIAMYLDKQ